jgi:hypothetical protein
MNERIQALAEQAETYADYYAMLSETGEKEIFIKKFAELIVKECSDLFEIEWGEEKLTGNDVGYVLKKHFGVEE